MISYEPPETKVVSIGDYIEGLGTVLDPDDEEIVALMENVAMGGAMDNDRLLPCPFCGGKAEYVTNRVKGHGVRWAVACVMTSNTARDNNDVMCRCRTPFVRSKEHAGVIWNRRA